MSLFVQYLLVILVLLAVVGLFILVSVKHDKGKGGEDCTDNTHSCATCTEGGCSLKSELLEKSAGKRLHPSK